MSEAWNRGDRDVSSRTPLHGGEHAGHSNDRGARQTRHILLGVSHASDDPARHRLFEIRATYDQAANGWVAQVAEQNCKSQPGAWSAELLIDAVWSHVFPTAATCLGDAVTSIVALVDGRPKSPVPACGHGLRRYAHQRAVAATICSSVTRSPACVARVH
jgi:hypothetical protein